MTDIIVKDIKNGSEYYYGWSAEVAAEDVSYDNTTSGMTADNVQEAIDEVFQSVSNGKELIADAITDKGVQTSASDSFSTMATNISLIGTVVPGTETTPIVQWDYTLLKWPCDDWYHVPLREEWNAIISLSWSIYDPEKLHIPFSWNRNEYDATWENWWEESYFWTVTPNSWLVYVAYFHASTWGFLSRNRSMGNVIRAFRNVPIIPDWTWSEIVSNRIWHNSEFWLITVRTWTDKYVTMQDKNVWATSAWSTEDPINSANRWKYFQRWNNNWFERNGSWDTSSTKVDTNTYWPNNPYNSDTFITWTDWSTVKNDNLRWYTDFTS